MGLIVNERVSLNLRVFKNLFKRQSFIHVLVQSLSTHAVQIISEVNLLGRQLLELVVSDADTDAIVHIGPLRREVQRRTVICVAVDEIACFIVVRKYVGLFKSAVVFLTPTLTQTGGLAGLDDSTHA